MTWWKVTRFSCKPLNISIVQDSTDPRPNRRIEELRAEGYRYDGASGMWQQTVYDFTYTGEGELIQAETPEDAWRTFDERSAA